MKVVAFNSSPRAGGNTEIMMKKVLEVLESEGIETEYIKIGGEPVFGCRACGTCFKMKNNRCVIEDDKMNEWYAKMVEADGILLGSPTQFADVNTEMKALIDRCGYIARANNDTLSRKAGAAVSAVRRAGVMHTLDTMTHFFTIASVYVVSSSYWNLGIGRKRGEVVNDTEGMETMETLGYNMAYLLKKLNQGEIITKAPGRSVEERYGIKPPEAKAGK